MLGEYIAAIHALEDARLIPKAREAERRAGFDPMDVVRSLRASAKPRVKRR
jgi:hypothetical protein